MSSYYLELNVIFFYYKHLFQLQTGLILKRSAHKKLSEPEQYDRPSNGSVRHTKILASFSIKYSKIWFTSHNYIKKTKFCVLCSPSFKQDYICILFLKDLIGFMKRFYEARFIEVAVEKLSILSLATRRDSPDFPVFRS